MSRWLVTALLLAGCAKQVAGVGLINQLDREVAACKERSDALEAQVLTCGEGGISEEIYTQLVQIFSGTEVKIRKVGARTVVEVPGSLLFGAGSTTVRDEAVMVVDMLSTALQLHPDQAVMIVGYTDDLPISGSMKKRFESNWELSAARAASFMRSLSRMGVPEDRMLIAGRGPMSPVSHNDTPEGREQNRRLLVIIGPDSGWR